MNNGEDILMKIKNYTFKCEDCEKTVKVSIEGKEIYVEPCEYCLEKEYDRGCDDTENWDS